MAPMTCNVHARNGNNALNDHLLNRPDHPNSQIGILTPFREESVVLYTDMKLVLHKLLFHPKTKLSFDFCGEKIVI